MTINFGSLQKLVYAYDKVSSHCYQSALLARGITRAYFFHFATNSFSFLM